MTEIVAPNYGRGSFADLPALIRHCLTGEAVAMPATAQWGAYLRPYDVVILVLVDAFGWRFFERFAGTNPLLQRIERDGRILKWTSQFPSTTSAHLTCLHTGLTPGASGVFEWQFYEPTLDRVILPLFYSFAGDQKRETLRRAGVEAASLLPQPTFYTALQERGVTSHIYQSREFTPSSYSDWMYHGAQTHPGLALAEAAVNLRLQVTTATTPMYCFLYIDKVDTLGHYYGPDSAQMDAEIETTLFVLEQALVQPLTRLGRNALLIVTADHGMMETDPRTTRYLNTDPQLQGVLRFLRGDGQGRLLPPGGSPRDVFLYVKEGYLEEATTFLATQLTGHSTVRTTQSLINADYFGPPPFDPRFRARVGDLVILPNPGESVWWYEKDRFEQRFYGHHGGLTPAEMAIPLGLLALNTG